MGVHGDEQVCAKSVNLVALMAHTASQHLESPGADFEHLGRFHGQRSARQHRHRPHWPRRMAHSSHKRPLGDLHMWRATPSSLRDKANMPPAWTQACAMVLAAVELPAGLHAPKQSAQAQQHPNTHQWILFIAIYA
jgi:hypothetical protein